MKVIYPLLWPLACLLISANTHTPALSEVHPIILKQHNTVSLISVIANPDKYDGQKIQLIGYLHLEFEGNGLYLHKDDYYNAISKNALWVSLEQKHPELGNLKQYSDHYVIIEGIFDGHDNGHMNMNSGCIKNITRLEIWEPANWKITKKVKKN